MDIPDIVRSILGYLRFGVDCSLANASVVNRTWHSIVGPITTLTFNIKVVAPPQLFTYWKRLPASLTFKHSCLRLRKHFRAWGLPPSWFKCDVSSSTSINVTLTLVLNDDVLIIVNDFMYHEDEHLFDVRDIPNAASILASSRTGPIPQWILKIPRQNHLQWLREKADCLYLFPNHTFSNLIVYEAV